MCDAESGIKMNSIGLFCPEDAPALARLFQIATTGSNQEVLHSPEQIIEWFSRDNVYLVVARSSEGEILGYIDLWYTNSEAGKLTVNMVFVLPDHRAQNVGNQLMSYVINELTVALGVEQVWGEIICNHTFMQQLIINFRGRFRGYDIALAVDVFNPRGPNDNHRVSAMIMGGTYVNRPQTLYLPPIYRQDLIDMYGDWHGWHRFLASYSHLPRETQTEGKINMTEASHLARVIIYHIGSDFDNYLQQTEEKIMVGDITVLQIYLPLTNPWTGGAVDILRSHAYFLGGPVPRWYDDHNDALLMQKTKHQPNFAGIKLFSDHARFIYEVVKNDWALVNNC